MRKGEAPIQEHNDQERKGSRKRCLVHPMGHLPRKIDVRSKMLWHERIAHHAHESGDGDRNQEEEIPFLRERLGRWLFGNEAYALGCLRFPTPRTFECDRLLAKVEHESVATEAYDEHRDDERRQERTLRIEADANAAKCRER